MGISTMYGIPIRLATQSSSITSRTGAKPVTYCQPSFRSASVFLPRRVGAMAASRISNREAITAR
jgi:hypothetical protein